MTLPEKIYDLRKKLGITQEQLAGQLGVSRQAVSKWESGQSVPDAEKIVSMSSLFRVSTDYLMKEDGTPADAPAAGPAKAEKRGRLLAFGAALCILGILGVIVFGIVMIAHPQANSQESFESTVRLGSGAWVAVPCAAALAGGLIAVRAVRKKK